MDNVMPASREDSNKFYRFQIFQGVVANDGKVAKTKSVGMAYLKDGQDIYTMRLWMFLTERFYLLKNHKDASKYFIMTREPNKNPSAKNRYFWNIVGNGTVDSVQGLIQLQFDLLEKSLYLNIYPESSAFSVSLPEPEPFSVAG